MKSLPFWHSRANLYKFHRINFARTARTKMLNPPLVKATSTWSISRMARREYLKRNEGLLVLWEAVTNTGASLDFYSRIILFHLNIHPRAFARLKTPFCVITLDLLTILLGWKCRGRLRCNFLIIWALWSVSFALIAFHSVFRVFWSFRDRSLECSSRKWEFLEYSLHESFPVQLMKFEINLKNNE